MPLIEWSSAFLLGVKEFDDHHEHLVSLLNSTYDEFVNGASRMNLEKIIDQLIDYATYHFASEEYWMKEHLYPKIMEHSEEHDRFSGLVVQFQKDFHSGDAHLTMALLSFLAEWVSTHIRKADAEYGRFFLEKSLSR